MSARALRLTTASTIEAAPVRWLWPGYIPLGKVTVLAGAPGLGKSLLTNMLASRVSQITNVLIASAEDDPADTIKPRLMAAGADCDRVHLMDVREVTDEGLALEGIVQLPDDAYAIHQTVRETSARLVVLDPVAAFLDADHSAYREQEVRAALAPLKHLAEDTGAAVLLVMHLNKADGADPLRRIANSGAFTALARSVLVFGADPEDEEGDRGSRRILTVAKGNLRQAGNGSMQMAIETVPLEVAGQHIDTARLVEIGESNVSAEDLLGSSEDRGAKGEAMTWLRDLLAGGPMAAKEVHAAAERDQVAIRTLKRAKQSLGVRSIKDGGDGGWIWSLEEPPVAPGPLGPLGTLPGNSVASVGPLRRGPGNVAKEAKGPNALEGSNRTLDEITEREWLDAFPGSSWEVAA